MRFLTDILAKAGLIVDGTTTLNGAAAATVDTDKFVVLDGAVVKYRTGAQLLSDIGAGGVSSVALATGTTGTDVNVSGSPITGSGTITINIPSASTGARGLVTTIAQTFQGTKTFNSSTVFNSFIDLGTYIRMQSLSLSSGTPDAGKGYVWYNNSNNRLWFRNDQNQEFDLTLGGAGTVTSVALATGTTGTDVNVSGSPITGSGTITLNIPDASTTARGLVTTGGQSFAGSKTFQTLTVVGSDYGTNYVRIQNYLDAGGHLAIQTGTIGGSFAGAGFITLNSTTNSVLSVIFNGATDGRIASFSGTSLTAERTYTLPNASGTIALVGGAGVGTVTSLSVVSANGFAGTVATATSTPAITISTTVTGLLKGNGTAISAAVANTDYQSPITLTTTGSSGAATFNGTTLNIPQYSGGGTSTTRYNENFTATSNQTAFTVTNALTNGFFDVYLNGVKLDPNSFTNTSTVITLVDGAQAGDILQVVNYSTLGIVSTLPSQTGNAGKYLTTDGTNLSWATVSSGAYTVTSVSTTYSETATTGTKIIKATTAGGAFTITLPTAVGNTATIIIKKTAGTADLTIDGAGSETIDGGATATVRRIDESITLISDNSNWFIV
jgi:hypothetical protein